MPVGSLLNPLSYIYYQRLVFDAPKSVHVFQEDEIKKPGTYVVELFNWYLCLSKFLLTIISENTVQDLEVKGSITWRSSHGYLFPEEFPLILISEVLGGIYFFLFTVFGALCVFYRSSLFKIHV